MGRKMNAQRESKCSICGKIVHINDPIEAVPIPGLPGQSNWPHERCVNKGKSGD